MAAEGEIMAVAKKIRLTWESLDENTYLLKPIGNFICTLEKQAIGVYGMGKAWYLKVRKPDETKSISIDHYWIQADGGYNSYEKESRKLMDGLAIREAAIAKLRALAYIE